MFLQCSFFCQQTCYSNSNLNLLPETSRRSSFNWHWQTIRCRIISISVVPNHLVAGSLTGWFVWLFFVGKAKSRVGCGRDNWCNFELSFDVCYWIGKRVAEILGKLLKTKKETLRERWESLWSCSMDLKAKLFVIAFIHSNSNKRYVNK